MKTLFTLIFILFCLNSFSQIDYLEIPKFDSTYVQHTDFSLSYSSTYKLAFWSAYELNPSDTVNNYERSTKYSKDDILTQNRINTATANDFKNSGYDRGHLTPANDMRYDYTTSLEVNVYSNIVPQNPSFNRGIWSSLENRVTNLTKKYKNIYIITGPILTSNMIKIGTVSVPEFYYKVLVVCNNGQYKGIGFIIPNKKCETLTNYSVPINLIESLTGIDFFYRLDDTTENNIEKNSDYNSIFN